MSHSIFISYSRHDLKKAKKIKSEIENETGISCWMDMDGIESGEQFEDVIISAIDNATIVLFLLSENSMNSKWAKDEVRYAIETNKKIVPINIDDSTPHGWFLFKLSGRDVIYYSKLEQMEKLMLNLKEWTRKKESIDDTESLPANDEGVTPGNVEGANDRERRKSAKTYYTSPVRLGIIAQTIGFSIILIMCLYLLFWGVVSMYFLPRTKDILLILTMVGMLYSTFKIRKYKFCKWSFLLLDLLALVLFISMSKNIYNLGVWNGFKYKTYVYQNLNAIGKCWVYSPRMIIAYYAPLYVLHNICLLTIMYGKTIWEKIPYRYRKLVK